MNAELSARLILAQGAVLATLIVGAMAGLSATDHRAVADEPQAQAQAIIQKADAVAAKMKRLEARCRVLEVAFDVQSGKRKVIRKPAQAVKHGSSTR